ncbi:MAG TPA: FtsW/RodA/SpoVE family cell cycle protein [Fimbriimonadaceae bacterium]|nr:FtsW/RodA/SpoVE family cell cycle protein [Fimbriimonadaceae bacterium]
MKRRWQIPDPALFLLTFAATLIGALMIFDAGYARSLAQGLGPIPREFTSQAMFAFVALIVAYGCARVSVGQWRRWAVPLFWLSFLSLLAVEFFGKEMNGAKRWIDVGVLVQPAEFAKIACVVFLAAVFASRKPWVAPKKSPRDWAAWMDRVGMPKLIRGLPLLAVLVAVYLVEREPDLGTAAVIGAVAFILIFLGGVSRWSLVAVVIVTGIGLFAMVKQEPYRIDRITNHAQRWNPDHVDDVGYQTTQSEAAMANGGWTGVGIGAGRSKHMLPAATTDFILATTGEEFGLLGVLFVLVVLGGITFRLIVLGNRHQDKFGKLILYGTASWIGVQTCVNVMMANGYLPAIGIPLPFVSSGGSSLVALWIAIGICQSVVAKPRQSHRAVVQDDERAAEPSRARRQTPRPEPRMPVHR